MTDPENQKEPKAGRGQMGIVLVCCSFVIGMVGMSYAAVPLYKAFCQATGYGGTTQRVEQASDRILDKTIVVRFDSNVAPGLDWSFKPVQRQVKLRIGETTQISYTATNHSKTAITGQATYNVTPQAAGSYFNKIQCFCFTETTLQPGETLDMPVVFFVDPDIADEAETKDIGTITLSYTFYAHETEKPVAALAEPVQEKDSL